jgi:hypothetical protein
MSTVRGARVLGSASLRSAVIVGSVLAGLFLSACGQQQSGSELTHNADEPVRDPGAFNWASVDDAEYRAFMAPLFGLEDNFLPASHAVTKRTQFWIDQFDANLRARYPREMENVPAPSARVIINPSLNAFVGPVPVCIPVSGSWAGANGNRTTEIAYFDVTTGEFSEWPEEQIRCREETDPRQARLVVQSIVDAFNRNSLTRCRLQVASARSGTLSLRSNADCSVGQDLDGIGSSGKIALMRTGSWINVYTGMIPEMGEAEFAGVIAHELGHYYRAHVTGPKELDGYFYRLQEANAPTRPERDPSLDALGERVVKGSAMVKTAGVFKSLRDQRFHSKVYLAVGSIGTQICAGGRDCNDECQAFADIVADRTYVSDTNFFPFRELSATGRRRYAEFETAAAACLATVPTTGQGSIDWVTLATLVMRPTWPSWLTNSQDITSTVEEFGRSTLSFVPAEAPRNVTHVASAYEALSEIIRAAELDSDRALREAYETRLGHYTFEQEADEISAEWMTQIGVDPNAAVGTYLSIGRWVASQGADSSMPFDVGVEECERLYRSGWRAEDGSYKYIALGDYSDPHHSFCYRAFNLDRDIRAHGFAVPRGVTPPQMDDGYTWAEIQAMSASASSSDMSPAGGSSGRGLISRFVHNNCPLAPRSMHRFTQAQPAVLAD